MESRGLTCFFLELASSSFRRKEYPSVVKRAPLLHKRRFARAGSSQATSESPSCCEPYIHACFFRPRPRSESGPCHPPVTGSSATQLCPGLLVITVPATCIRFWITLVAVLARSACTGEGCSSPGRNCFNCLISARFRIRALSTTAGLSFCWIRS